MCASTDPLLTQAPREAVRIGPYLYHVPGGVQRQGLGRFEGKVTIGDYGFDSDQLMSSWIQSSWLGGMGTKIHQEGTTDDQFWDATLETRTPAMLALLRETVTIPGPAGTTNAFPLADFPGSGPSFWVAFDTQLATWDASTTTFVNKGTPLPTSPVAKAVEYRDMLYVPLGASGYARVDTAGAWTIEATVKAVSFTVWDDKLLALTTDRYLRVMDTSGVWEAVNEALRVPSSAVPRVLVGFLDQNQNPTVHIVTNRDVWAYDRDTPRLYKTHLEFPPHPDQGKAACNWRGDAMFVTVGVGIHRYNGATIAAMGPDGRYGLPSGLRGSIVDLTPEYNNLIAVIKGESSGTSGAVETLQSGLPLYAEDSLALNVSPVKSCLLRWTESGWHKVWESPTAAGFPTWAFISVADGAYRLWWGYAGDLYTQELPVSFYNAETGIQIGTDRFAARGSLITGWFDAGMAAYDKLGSHVEVTLEDVLETGEPMGSVSVYYQTETVRTWTLLGLASDCGKTVLPLGVEPHPVHPASGATFSAGLPFRKIRLRYDVAQAAGHPAWSPVTSNIILKFLKIPLSGQEAFTVTIDLTHDAYGQGIDTIRQYLYAAVGSTAFLPFVHMDQEYRVRIAQSQGQEATGRDERGSMTLNVVGIPVPANTLIPRAT